MSQQQRRSSSQQTITGTMPLIQVHSTMQSITSAVKNATEAKSHLATKGWSAPGERIALDVLTRILFAVIADTPRLHASASATIASVAYLLTETQQDGLLEDMANKISLHIKDTLDSITSDLHVKLDQHVQAVVETAQSQATLTDKLIKAQEKLDETTQKALTSKTYSQVVASGTPTVQTTLPPQHHSHRSDYETVKKSKSGKSSSSSTTRRSAIWTT